MFDDPPCCCTATSHDGGGGATEVADEPFEILLCTEAHEPYDVGLFSLRTTPRA